MKVLKHINQTLIFLVVLCNIGFSQFIDNYQDISKQDMIDALEFAGINIMKIDLENKKRNYKLKVIIDEYNGIDNFVKSDTVIDFYTKYNRPSDDSTWIDDYITSIRLISRVLNNNYDTIYLIFSTTPFSVNEQLNIAEKYQRKHYWIKFAKTNFEIGKKIPLLFYASEWDEIINGKKITRFCSKKEISINLDDETIKFIPHFFIISYQFDELDTK